MQVKISGSEGNGSLTERNVFFAVVDK